MENHASRGYSTTPASVQLMRQFTAEHERELKELVALRREIRELRSQVHAHSRSSRSSDGKDMSARSRRSGRSEESIEESDEETDVHVMKRISMDPPIPLVHVSQPPDISKDKPSIECKPAKDDKKHTEPFNPNAGNEIDSEAPPVTEVVDLTAASEQNRHVRLTTQSLMSDASSASSRLGSKQAAVHDYKHSITSMDSQAVQIPKESPFLEEPRHSVGEPRHSGARSSMRTTHVSHRSVFCCDSSQDDENSVFPYDDDFDQEQGHLDRVCEMCADFAEIMGWTRGGGIDNQRASRVSIAAASLQFQSFYAHSIVDSPWFDPICTCMIVLNATLQGLSANWAASTLYSHEDPDDLPVTYKLCNLLFTVLFTVELLIRMFGWGWRFFCGADMFWNCFDSIVVVADLTDMVFSLIVGQSKGSSSLFLRTIRVLRMARSFRLIRVLRFFRELRMMVYSILKCSTSLAWAVSLFFLIIYIFGLYFMQQVIHYLHDANYVDPDFDRLKADWGSVEATLYTLFASMTDGKNWADVNAPLIRIHRLNTLVMAFFIFLSSMFLANILTGIFVETAIQSAQHDRDEVIQEQMMQDDCLAQQFREILHEMDTDHSGFITLPEFEALLRNKEIRALLKSLGLEVDQAKGLFKLLDIDHSRAIGIEEFVYGCVRLKGTAKSIDLATLMFENKRLVEQFRLFFDEVRDGFATLAGFETRVDNALQELAAKDGNNERRQGDSMSSNNLITMYNSRMLAPYGGRMGLIANRFREDSRPASNANSNQASPQASLMLGSQSPSNKNMMKGRDFVPDRFSDNSVDQTVMNMIMHKNQLQSPQKWKGLGQIFSMPGSRRGSAVAPLSMPNSRRVSKQSPVSVPSSRRGSAQAQPVSMPSSRRGSAQPVSMPGSRRVSKQHGRDGRMNLKNSPMPTGGMLEPIRGSMEMEHVLEVPMRSSDQSRGQGSGVRREVGHMASTGSEALMSLDGSESRANKVTNLWQGFFGKSDRGPAKRTSASAPSSARHSEESMY